MGAKLNLQGQRFGKLLVLNEDGRYGTNVLWRCRCDCGNEVRVRANSLMSGNTTTCGCGRIEAITSHGMTDTQLFNAWRGMKRRCQANNDRCFDDYRGRGITVCEEWANDFESFKAWALANGYENKPRISLDRIDNDKGYSPDNCRWVTAKEQGRNRRSNVFLEYNGERHCLAEWAEKLGIDPRTIGYRYRAGWSVQEILYGKA